MNIKNLSIFQKIFVLIAACALPVIAQSDDYNKVEVFAGYSLAATKSTTDSLSFTDPGGQTQTFNNLCSQQTGEMLGPNSQGFFCDRRNFNGFNASIAFNFSRYVGIKGDVSGNFKKETFVDRFDPPGLTQTIAIKEKLFNFLAGVQIKDNGKTARFKPFVHALFGAARYTNTQRQTLDLFPQGNFVAQDKTTSFAMKLGGGIDVRAGKRVDIRVIGFDYNPIFGGDRDYKTVSGPFTFSSTGRRADNVIFSFGIVIH